MDASGCHASFNMVSLLSIMKSVLGLRSRIAGKFRSQSNLHAPLPGYCGLQLPAATSLIRRPFVTPIKSAISMFRRLFCSFPYRRTVENPLNSNSNSLAYRVLIGSDWASVFASSALKIMVLTSKRPSAREFETSPRSIIPSRPRILPPMISRFSSKINAGKYRSDSFSDFISAGWVARCRKCQHCCVWV